MARKKGKGMGRPPLPDDQRLSKFIMVRFTEGEFEELQAAARDKPVATVAREVLVKWSRRRNK